MREGVPRIASLQRALAVLEAVVADGGRSSVAVIARHAGVPLATAHRQVATFESEGYLVAAPKGGFVVGPRLLGLIHTLDETQVLARLAQPILDHRAADLACVLQLGTLENDMVTYLAKAGANAARLFTIVGSQLEAYCSAIGKVLLAHQPAAHIENYLAGGNFVPLTEATIIDPRELARQLEHVRQAGYATDREEIAHGLFCIAVPLFDERGTLVAALSASQFANDRSWREPETLVQPLQEIARELAGMVFGAKAGLPDQLRQAQ